MSKLEHWSVFRIVYDKDLAMFWVPKWNPEVWTEYIIRSYGRLREIWNYLFHWLVFLCFNRMWREIKLLSASKPVIASMADVAASGGYYMAMAAQTIVAENLTITGSIGVVTG